MFTLNSLTELVAHSPSTPIMPALFVGHGSPMNAIEYNEFALAWQRIGEQIPTPTAILCISAHWETRGTFVTAMEKPKTIHDFYGFPKELFDVNYPAPGSQELAALTRSTITSIPVELDQSWGLDHGCWSVLKHMYPKANIPVVQLSMNQLQKPEWHYELGKELSTLREKGILIIGSGNIVHNLGAMNWKTPETGYDWAIEANNTMKTLIQNGDHQSLSRYNNLGTAVAKSIPTPEHYLPLLYLLGLNKKQDTLQFFNDKTIYGSISMTSVMIG